MPTIRADKTQIMQLFQNLICNGIKYNESIQPRVNINCRSEGQAVKLSVKDNGIGIPAEYRDKVFNMFQRLPNAQKNSGTGIGLTICKKIVEGMKGKISIAENITGGTIFNIYLPLSLG
jgi:signal transduction histidine kinase